VAPAVFDIDPAIPPATVAFEWNARLIDLSGVKRWYEPASQLNGDDRLGAATTIVERIWSLVDPVTRWLMADCLADPRSGEARKAAGGAIRGTSRPLADRRSQIELLDVSELLLLRDDAHFRRASSPSAQTRVSARTEIAGILRQAVDAIEVEFLNSSGDPQLLLVDEYRCIQLHDCANTPEFLMSHRGDDWFISVWPALRQALPRLLAPQPSGPGSDPSGVREPLGPLPPHAHGSATLPLPGEE